MFRKEQPSLILVSMIMTLAKGKKVTIQNGGQQHDTDFRTMSFNVL